MRLYKTTEFSVKRARRYCGRNSLRGVSADKKFARRTFRRKLDEQLRKFGGDWEAFDFALPYPFSSWDII